jgi:hypothetical protein
MNKRDKAHGQIVSKADYVESLVSSHFGWAKDPKFRHLRFSGIQSIGLGIRKVFIYVDTEETKALVSRELEAKFAVDEIEWVTVSVIGKVTPA